MGGVDPLAGCIAKVERAEAHLATLFPLINAFLSAEREPKPYRLAPEIHAESARCLWRFRVVEKPPLDWSMIVGDYLQNLRAALDHLVWILVRANGCEPSRGNCFPLFDVEPSRKRANGERGRWNRQVAGLHPAVINFIEDCQPYKAPDGPDSHILGALRTLSNEDKHRTVLPTLIAINEDATKFKFKSLEVRDIKVPPEPIQMRAGRPLQENDVALEMPIEITGPQPEVKLVGAVSLDVGFGGRPVPVKGLEQMAPAVAQVLARCTRFLGEQ
jgi:hypothetical protein